MQRSVPVTPLILDSSAAIKLSINQGSPFQERLLLGRNDLWHEVKVIRGAQYDKEEVLKAILNAVEPADLIPVKYQVCGEDSFFIIKNCGPAIEKLCRSSLIIKNPHGNPLILTITLGFASVHDLKVNMQPLLLTALTKRYDPDRKALDLEAFHKDDDVSKTIYCPLSQPRTLTHILKLAKNALATFEYLDLRNNELHTLSGLEKLDLSNIKYIDLRHNNLTNMENLSPLKKFHISKIWLDDNPLCENYSNAKKYIDSAKIYCPHIIQLDGVRMASSNMPLIYDNYFKDQRQEKLVNQFLMHFFNLYDGGDRMDLRGLYHENAFYSMSFGMPFSLAHKKNLTQFTASRNIVKTSDPAKRANHLYYGAEEVLRGLKRLPKSYHDKNSFQCDVVYEDKTYILISVCGLFKNLSNNVQVLSFNRTFLLMLGPDNEYNIMNDQYYVEAAPEDVSSDSIDSKIVYDEFVPTLFSKSEKMELIAKFGDVTKLNDEWCDTYLSEANWDIRKAIQNFMKDLKCSSLPIDAFQI